MMERPNSETELPHATGAVQNEAAAWAAVGAKLREARERAGMSVDDVANRLKFSPRQIEALEEGNLAQLPERAFIRGFIRSYAKLVHLDDKPLLSALPGAPAPAPAPAAGPKVSAPPLFSVLEAHRTNLLWLGGALVLVVIIIAIWPSGRKSESGLETNRGGVPSAASAVQAASAPVPAAAAPAPVPAPAPIPRAHEPESRRAAAPVPAPAKKPRKATEAGAKQPASGVPAVGPEPTEAASGVSATAKPRAAALLRLVCDEDSWVEVKDETGAVLLSQLCLAGSEQRVTSALPLSVVAGNANGVKVYYKGRQIDLAPNIRADGAARLKLR